MKDPLIWGAIALGYLVLILALLVAAIWTWDLRWALTAVILVLPSVLIALIPARKKEPRE